MNQTQIRNFCIIAHIDHGKSTLADRLLEVTHTVEARAMKPQLLDQLELERERGITIKLAPVRMVYQPEIRNPKSEIRDKLEIQNTKDSKPNGSFGFGTSDLVLADSKQEFVLNLIDTPGHADFSYEVSRSLAAVEGAILLVDATQGIQAQTLTTLYQAMDQNLVIIPAVNKIDLREADPDGAARDLAKLLGVEYETVLRVSGKTGQGVAELIEAVVERIPVPKGQTEVPLRALIFDSKYDSYRGVIALVRIVDGAVTANEKIRFLRTKTEDQALEVGVFRPALSKSDKLAVGEIGYIVTSLKDVSQARVGDTITTQSPITDRQSRDIQPLAGYREPMPMVFAGLYPSDGEVEKLREALGKLKLNDAALVYEPTSSKAFGLGFRAGFLGLLHLEIVKERLEREYNLELIITSPSVGYRERPEGGRTVYAEPWVRAELLTPENYLGAVMDLAQSRRGIYQGTEYLATSSGPRRTLLKYEMPLAELITDFYDELKSRTSGYASMSYEFLDFREEDLAKLDIFVADEPFDVLSQIVHRTQAERRARSFVARLKELIPRQMFEVKIQAAIGGKILASERISAMKKDVTGYLYGGDITRKRKLWSKQAKGKKRMKQFGKVSIPDDVFVQILKKG
ncbi:MAG: translation elongation factor 4 [Patescibacteria group bacterium]